jgi:large subunit ribosomal protein L9
MQIILLEKVRNLGDVGHQVNVKNGYGRNYLIPQGKAVPANKANIEYFKQKRAELEQAEKAKYEKALERADKLKKLDKVVVYARASAEGKLYGSVGPAILSEAIAEAGVTVERREIELPFGPLRYLGDYEVNVVFHSDVQQTVLVEVQTEV